MTIDYVVRQYGLDFVVMDREENGDRRRVATCDRRADAELIMELLTEEAHRTRRVQLQLNLHNALKTLETELKAKGI